MIEKSITIYKRLGETPLEALERFRAEHPAYEGLPMTYAGRLDPMATGELLLLAGEECKRKDKYLGLNKDYEFEILFGFTTDTYDLLGLATPESCDAESVQKQLASTLKSFEGIRMQAYPPYSSKTVGGVPLFQKSRDGQVFDLPKREVEVHDIHLVGFREIKGSALLSEIEHRISAVTSGDFRQEKILPRWKEFLAERGEEVFLIARVFMSASSGTYVRALVHDLPFPATTFSIHRTKIHLPD